MNASTPRFTTRLSALAVLALLVSVTLGAAAGRAPAKTPKSFYGVVPQSTLKGSDYRKMKGANVHTLRSPLYWLSAEQRPSQYDFSRFDSVVKRAAKQHIRVFPYVFGTPNWVARNLDNRKCGSLCAVYAPRSAKALQAWKKFNRKAAARYGPGGHFWNQHPDLPRLPVRSWQIWNEQNYKYFYRPKPDPRRYAKLLTNASRGIGGVDPKADVILGGMFGVPGGGKGGKSIATVDFLKKLYRVHDIKRRFNGIALHPYSATVRYVKYQARLARGALRRAHDSSTDLWITEIGWASGGPKHPVNVGSKRAQAQRVTEVYKAFEQKRREWNVRAVMWFAWQDSDETGESCSFCARIGLVTRKGKPKPALGAYRRVAR